MADLKPTSLASVSSAFSPSTFPRRFRINFLKKKVAANGFMLFFFDDCSDVVAGAAAAIVDAVGNVDIVETDDVAATSEKELLSGLVT